MVRKGAGTETRPLASSLLMNVETKRSIPLLEPRLTPSTALPWLRANSAQSTSRAAIAPKGAGRRELGMYGITWAEMGVNGKTVGWDQIYLAVVGRGLGATCCGLALASLRACCCCTDSAGMLSHARLAKEDCRDFRRLRLQR